MSDDLAVRSIAEAYEDGRIAGLREAAARLQSEGIIAAAYAELILDLAKDERGVA